MVPAVLVCMLVSAIGSFAANEPDEVRAAKRELYQSLIPYTHDVPSVLPSEFILSPEKKLTVLGDSIVQFGNAVGGFTRLVDHVIQTEFEGFQQIDNQGVAGYKARDMLECFNGALTNVSPTYVVISVGVNDVEVNAGLTGGKTLVESLDFWRTSRSVKRYRKNLKALTRSIRDRGAVPLFMTPTVRGENPESKANKALASYAQAMKDVARGQDAYMIDCHQIFINYLKANDGNQTSRMLTRDGIHLNDTGQRLMAIALAQLLGLPENFILMMD